MVRVSMSTSKSCICGRTPGKQPLAVFTSGWQCLKLDVSPKIQEPIFFPSQQKKITVMACTKDLTIAALEKVGLGLRGSGVLGLPEPCKSRSMAW